ncbi:MAG TPA: hypothetical protein PLG60_00270 [Acidimicrobiales bacterium]|nr:MAG: hypothetical protein B7X07_01615 [Actinobacteria bacterium 21-64-8]HQT98916.1 hypothetical protein [Acidimicrobiales bacterium]
MEADFDEGRAISDDELSALALAADPSAPIDTTAPPWRGAWASGPLLIPEWYMPRPTSSSSRRRRGALIAIGLVLAGLLIIDAFGLCITSGFLSLA